MSNVVPYWCAEVDTAFMFRRRSRFIVEPVLSRLVTFILYDPPPRDVSESINLAPISFRSSAASGTR